MALYNCKVPVIIKKKNNFTLCPGKLRENLINIFPGVTNKIQGLSRTAKKIKDFSRMWQPCNRNPKLYPNSNPSTTLTLILI